MIQLRVALPKGKLLVPTSAMLERAGWGLDDYNEKARVYRLKSRIFQGLEAKMFQEKDIPIQVAVGNYDLGICGMDWVSEQAVKYPSSAAIPLRDMNYGDGSLFAAASPGTVSNGRLVSRGVSVRIASEYPNLAESLAQTLRLRRFSIYPLWGSADAYPPENAEIALLSRKSEHDIAALGLEPIGRVLDFRACLIVNRDSLRSKNLSALLSTIYAQPEAAITTSGSKMFNIGRLTQEAAPEGAAEAGLVRLALPDGHQQSHVRKILDAAGIQIDDYPSSSGNRRPKSGLDGFAITVIRPQDMPLQVANGNFDLAITGRDWLTDHLHQFPGSPARELLDLKYGWVRIVAVVHNDVPIATTAELRAMKNSAGGSLRIAAEYINIADNYARVNHLGRYRVIPTWGATEAFLPDDADVLIENTETGSTLAKNNLKIIETLFESTACVIGSGERVESPLKAERIARFVELMRSAVGTMK